MKKHFTKVSMNLNSRSIDNINKLCELTNEPNKTKALSIGIELARKVLEMGKNECIVKK